MIKIEADKKYLTHSVGGRLGPRFARVLSQFDDEQNAMWANPFAPMIVTLSESHLDIKIFDDLQAFTVEIFQFCDWHKTNGLRFRGINCEGVDSLKEEFTRAGLGDLLR
jgi:hypothetical protein